MTDGPDQRDQLPFDTRPTLLRRLTSVPARIRALRPWLERTRLRSPVLDAGLEAVERDSEIGGGILAGALAYRLFLFLLPLIFFGIAVLGLVSDVSGSDPRTVADGIGLVAVVSKEVATTSESGASVWVALTALVVLVYVTRVLHRAVAVVHALAWERSAASARAIPRSLSIFSLAVVAQLALTAGVGAARAQSASGGVLALAFYVAVSAGIWVVVSLHLPHGAARWADLVPGSLLYGAGLLGVHVFNTVLLGHVVHARSSTYGTLGAAAGVLLSLYILGRVIIEAAVLNATLFERKTQARAG